jgi:hypothetical protein
MSTPAGQNTEPSPLITVPRVIVATTAMLTFISFWRAAAIVLNDLASSAYYAGGESESFIGKSAPWFILGVMLFSYCVRAVYVESCSMFVRGGVYRVVKEALGGTLAKFSVSALMFDYVLTGPISGVSAGQYLAGLLNELSAYFHLGFVLSENSTAAFFAVLVTIFFWWENISVLYGCKSYSASSNPSQCRPGKFVRSIDKRIRFGGSHSVTVSSMKPWSK